MRRGFALSFLAVRAPRPAGVALLGACGAALLLGGCSTTAVRPADDTGAAVPSSRSAPPAPAARRGGAFYKDDGPGELPPFDLDLVPDAVPRPEPLHRFANRPYSVLGNDYVPATAIRPFRQRGTASWYGRRFHGQPTSSGEPYDMYAMSAAHPTLPIPSYARVTNMQNGRSVVVRINDRGPFLKGRVMDLSYTAAWRLGYVNTGSAEVEVETVIPDGALAVSPAPAQRAPREASASVFLQLGAFGSAANAEGLRSRVRENFSEYADRVEVVANAGQYRVHLGPFTSPAIARSEAERIGDALNLSPIVVQR